MTYAISFTCLLISLGLLVGMYILGRGRSVVFFVATFFTYFSFGPVINLLLGKSVYVGIQLRYVDQASIAFLAAIASLAIAQILMPSELPLRRGRELGQEDPATYPLLRVALIAFGCYCLISSIRLAPLLITGNKMAAISAAGGLHYILMAIQTALASMYFIARKDRATLRFWKANQITFVGYCIATFERDFIFIYFVLILFDQIVRLRRRAPIKLVAGGAIALVFASYLFSSRAGQATTWEVVLNQGSILFVDSFLMSQLDGALSFRSGSTYLNAILDPLPSWLSGTSSQSLSDWLVQVYSPGNRTSGYGFSLSGEAFLNFGYPGVVGIFLLVGCVLTYVVAKFHHGHFWSFLSVLFTINTMYSLRGDFSQLFGATAYGVFVFLLLVSVKGRSSYVRASPDTSQVTQRHAVE